jgi:O-antigen ligase
MSSTCASPDYTLESILRRIAYLFLWAFVFAVPFEEQVPPEISQGIAVSRWFGLASGCFTFLLVLIVRRFRKPIVVHYAMGIFVLWVVLSLSWSVAPEDTAIRIGTYLQLLLLVWLIWELAPTASLCRGLFFAYVLGTCVPCITTIQNSILGRVHVKGVEVRVVNGDRFTAGGINENDLGLLLVLSVPMSVYLLTRRKAGASAYLCWIQLGLAITTILLTGSRGSLISLVVALAIVPLSLPVMSKAKRSIFSIAIAGIIAGAIFFIPNSTWERLLTVESEMTQGTLTHRTSIWAAGVVVFRNNALLGVGSGAFGSSVRNLLDIPYVSHNLFLSVLVELGVIGALIAFALLFLSVYSTFRLPQQERRLWMVLLLSWAVGVSSLTWEYRKPTWILFGLLAAHIAAIKKQPGQHARPASTVAGTFAKSLSFSEIRLRGLGVKESDNCADRITE